MPRQHLNNAGSTLLGPISNSATSLDADDAANKLGTPTVSDPIRYTIEQGTTREIIEATGRTGNTLTGITRAVERCYPDAVATAYSFIAGAKIEVRATAASFSGGGSADLTLAGGLRTGFAGSYVPLLTSYCAAFTNFGANLNQLRVHPILVTEGVTLDRIGIWLATASGDGTSVIRLGIWNYDGTNHRPSTLLVDSGALAVNGASNRFVEATISQALTPGRYFVGAVLQGTTNPATIAMTNSDSVGHIIPLRRTAQPAQTGLRLHSCLVYTGVSGALANITTDPSTTEGATPLIWGRYV